MVDWTPWPTTSAYDFNQTTVSIHGWDQRTGLNFTVYDVTATYDYAWRDPALDVVFEPDIERYLRRLPVDDALRVRRRILAARSSRILQLGHLARPERVPECVQERVLKSSWGFEHRQRCRTGRPKRTRYAGE